ncbi:Succinoglycan biosynthesis protein exoM [Sandaracinus amylolyticus]|nr:Succinoglycan biosynthesis protein exoM [Sandaracinus amylolyticus]
MHCGARMDTSIVIPTFRRNRSLRRAVRSCYEHPHARARHEIVVVDNSPDAGARDTVRALMDESPVPLRYEHEPRAGISYARNRGVAASRGERIAFLDDDEQAEPGWLEELEHAQARHRADAVFGAVIFVCEGEIPDGMEWALEWLTRDFDDPSGPLEPRRVAHVGTGSSMFLREALGSDAPFEVSLGLVGGEDTKLIRTMEERGGRLVWCREARVLEHVPPQRLELSSTLKYRFSCGQMRTYSCIARENPSLAEAAAWMLAGAMQAVGNTALAPASGVLLGRGGTNARLAAAAAGLGKVLWMEPFLMSRYRRPTA